MRADDNIYGGGGAIDPAEAQRRAIADALKAQGAAAPAPATAAAPINGSAGKSPEQIQAEIARESGGSAGSAMGGDLYKAIQGVQAGSTPQNGSAGKTPEQIKAEQERDAAAAAPAPAAPAASPTREATSYSAPAMQAPTTTPIAGNTYPTSPPPLNIANTEILPTQNSSQVRDSIFSQINALQAPTLANSATIKAQTEGYDLQSKRGLEDTRAALAESAYASGDVGTGGFKDAQQRAIERASADRAGFLGNAVKDAETQRKDNLMKSLGMGAVYEQQDKSLMQQESEFSRTQKQSQEQFDAKLKESASQFAAQMGFNYAELGQADKQFIDNLAWNKEKAAMDNATSMAGIGASAGAASAALSRQQARDLEDDRRWSAYNTSDVIDAANRAAIAKYMSGGGV